jgi:hypothetical protein
MLSIIIIKLLIEMSLRPGVLWLILYIALIMFITTLFLLYMPREVFSRTPVEDHCRMQEGTRFDSLTNVTN